MMKKRKNLERAVILGLLLSTSIYGTVFATEYQNGISSSGTYGDTTEDTTIGSNSNGYGINAVAASTQITVNGQTVTITSDNLTSGIRVASGGDVTVNAEKDIIVISGSDDNRLSKGFSGVTSAYSALGNTVMLDAKGDIKITGYTNSTANNTGLNFDAGNGSSKAVISAANLDINLDNSNGISRGIYINTFKDVDIETSGYVSIVSKGGNAQGVLFNGNAANKFLDIVAGGDINISANATRTNSTSEGDYAAGFHNTGSTASINSTGGSVTISAEGNEVNSAYGIKGAYTNTSYKYSGFTDIDAKNSVNISASLNVNNYDSNADLYSYAISTTGFVDRGQILYINAGQNIKVTSDLITEVDGKRAYSYGIYSLGTNVNLTTEAIDDTVIDTAQPTIFISSKVENNGEKAGQSWARGIYAYTSGTLKQSTIIDNQTGSTSIKAIANDTALGEGIFIDTLENKTNGDNVKDNVVNITSKIDNSIYGTYSAVQVLNQESALYLTAIEGSNFLNSDRDSYGAYTAYIQAGATLTMNAAQNNEISSIYNDALVIDGDKSNTSVSTLAANNNIIIAADSSIDSEYGSVSLTATNGVNNIISNSTENVSSLQASNSTLTLKSIDNKTKYVSNYIKGGRAIAAYDNSTVEIQATTGDNMVEAVHDGITAGKSVVKLMTNDDNKLYSGTISYIENMGGYYGDERAVYAVTGSNVTLYADKGNVVYGAVHAKDSGTAVDIRGWNGSNEYNDIHSAATIANAGGLTDTTVISALYAEAGAKINVNSANNTIITYYSKPEDNTTSERVIWAYDEADITVDGKTIISTAMYDKSPNNMDIAIAAGTATGLDEDMVNGSVADRATVNINYESDSSITGDILAAYAGTVNIAAKDVVARNTSEAKMNITGNLLAGNNGILNVDLGNGGVLNGRADDYGDAGLKTGHGTGEDTANSFFNPAFSSDILTGGEVSLNMGEGSRWNVTGQSWITNLTTTQNAEDTLINLANAKEDYNTNASALTIGKLDGSTRFYMNLDGDRSASDMLYIKSANGHYDIYLQDEVTTAEINSDKAGNQFNGLRFATVGEGSNASFTVRSQGTGSAFDVEYLVGTDSYAGNKENTAYNSTTGGSANIEKPGTDSVDNFFGVENSSSEIQNAANEIMLMANTEETAENVTANENTSLTEVTNFKIIDRAGEKLSDTGETILNMSRANYSNAIYMDRLNKRLGEARYINGEEDQGMWVRIRHDRIGKTDAYRSQNTMYELGYDEKQECDNGMRRVGFAIDYMHGDTGYNDIAGKGEIDRYGLWLYDTWMGDKGHYVDYVAKWGHLSNDFEVYTMKNGDKVTGDYSNNVFSISAEYGRKKDIGNDWYFEPQAQLQLARVTGADYTTNQDTKVSVDGINSLIGRAGFRLGKDFGEEKQSTVYIKADVLHEFLGDQDVYVYDKSSDNKWAGISYENEGTWYDVGIGFAAMMSKNSYAFLDLEKSFGHDNDETYQINAGMQWTF